MLRSDWLRRDSEISGTRLKSLDPAGTTSSSYGRHFCSWNEQLTSSSLGEPNLIPGAFANHTPAKQARKVGKQPPHAASVLGDIGKSFPCLEVYAGRIYICKRNVEISMIDKLIAHNMP